MANSTEDSFEARFNAHAFRCEMLLGQVNDLNRLSDDEKHAFEFAKAENAALLKLDSKALYTDQLNSYNQVLNDVLNNQEHWPTPRLGF